MPTLELAIEDSTGRPLGEGPLVTALAWEWTAQLNGAGTVRAELPAADPRLAELAPFTRLRARALVGGTWQTVGVGYPTSQQLTADGTPAGRLVLSGPDRGWELTWASAHNLALRDPATGAPVADALTQLLARTPGWTLDPAGYPATAAPVYLLLAQETILEALTKLAAQTDERFRITPDGTLAWLQHASPDSGVRAVAAADSPALAADPALALIAPKGGLQITAEGYDTVFRIYPHGAGNGDAALGLIGTTRTPPAGFTLNVTEGWIEATAARAAGNYPLVERHVNFNTVGAGGAEALDAVSAADSLFDAALTWLQQHLAPQQTYRLELLKCDTVLAPGQQIRVQWRGTARDPSGALYRWVDLDADLLIQSATLRVDASGLHTTALQVAPTARRAETSAAILARTVQALRAAGSHFQPGPGVAYTTTLGRQTFAGPIAAASLGVGNTVPAAGLGAITGAYEVFDPAGRALGWAPLYGSHT